MDKRLGTESDGCGWQAKAFLYCVEVTCPQSGWRVPLLPNRVVSKGFGVIAELVPDTEHQRYHIAIRVGVNGDDLKRAEQGTVVREGRYGEASLIHEVDGKRYKTKITTLRGDSKEPDGTIVNDLRLWEKDDFGPRPDDLLQERLYCIQWMRRKLGTKRLEYDFRSVTEADVDREQVVERYIAEHLREWQAKGWVPDMRIEVGGPPRYQGRDLVRSRGWTCWQHLFNARQLLLAGLINRYGGGRVKLGLAQVLNCNSRISVWSNSDGGGGSVRPAFYNQALSTLFHYGCRGFRATLDIAQAQYKQFEIRDNVQTALVCAAADTVDTSTHVFITDPPYGDAVKYEEILDFFIAWFRKNPAPEFAEWIWDSRRALAIHGEDENFRRGMVSAYKRMTGCMPNNGIQVIMFTHQSGEIWADMANIVWAAGLQVTAAWYVVTEADSGLRYGSNVKGTVLLVCRKREGEHRITRDELAWEIQDEVEAQVEAMIGLNQEARDRTATRMCSRMQTSRWPGTQRRCAHSPATLESTVGT